MMADFAAFIKRCAEARGAVEKMRHPTIVNHYDADGLAAGGLVAKALLKMGMEFDVFTTRKFGEEEAGRLGRKKELIFADLGGGQMDAVERLDADVVVIDHHQTRGSKILQANPHLFGFDGGSELSAAGCAYFVFKDVDPSLVKLGVVGAMGDMQFPLTGLNRKMLDDGVKSGKVVVAKDLTLFGRVSRPLIWFLQYCSEPYLPGLTGRQASCAQFFEELGIEVKTEDGKWRKYYELPRADKVKVVSGLVAHLCSNDADGALISSLVGETYTFPDEERGSELSDANEYSTVLNACGRHGKSEIGVGVCIGNAAAMEEAKGLLLLHRQQLREAVEFAGEAVEDFGVFHFLDGRGVVDDGLIGVVAGMLYGSAISRDKPIIALALNEEGQVKVSGRATKRLCADGVNLGKMLSEATLGIGVGGGHNIAAGAQVETGNVNGFLLRAGEITMRQMASSRQAQPSG